MAGATQDLTSAVETAGTAYHKLVLVVGPSGAGKSRLLRSFALERGHPFLNVNLGLSQRMLEMTKAQRARQAERLFQDMIAGSASDVFVLDNCEILFDRSLQLDPLRLFQAASRHRTVVASWNGTFAGGTLSYAEPQHPEYRSYRETGAVIVTAANAAAKTT